MIAQEIIDFLVSPDGETFAVKTIKTYGTRLEADFASLLLRAEGIAATVIGVGVAMEGGIDGVKLLVPDDKVDKALELLRES